MLGTNPLAVAFPGEYEPPIVIDMATSAVAFGKLVLARYAGQPIPDGWALDGDGGSLNDPHAFDEQCALAPLGGARQTSGHKGYCLASMVDLFCGVLSGACWGPYAPMFYDLESSGESVVGRGLGHFFGALRIDGFADPKAFKSGVDHWIRTFRNARPAAGTEGPLIPGDPERLAEHDRQTNGVPLSPVVEGQLRRLAERVSMELEPIGDRGPGSSSN